MKDLQLLQHQEAWALMPWVLNGSATPAQHAQLAQHLAHCAECQAEWDFQQALQAAVAAPTPAPAAPVEAMLARFWQMEPEAAASEALLPQAAGSAPGPRGSLPRRWWLVPALALLAGGSFWIGQQSRPPAATADFRLLSEAAPSAAQLRLVPAPTLTLAEWQALLQREGLQVVESAADGRHFGVVPQAPGADLQQLAERLRGTPGLLMVEVLR
jgi:Putative zinc-finger